jgi:hypothetical protein
LVNIPKGAVGEAVDDAVRGVGVGVGVCAQSPPHVGGTTSVAVGVGGRVGVAAGVGVDVGVSV